MKKFFLSIFLLAAVGVKLYAQTSDGDTTIYMKADTDPSFPGGYEAFQNYINNNKPITDKTNSNRFVVARVIVEKDGRLTKPTLKYHFQTTPKLDSAAIQLLKNSPAWKPAIKNGVSVRVSFNVQVRFETGHQKTSVRTPDANISRGQNAYVTIVDPIGTYDPNELASTDSNKIFTSVEQVPQFPGGIAALLKYLNDNNRLKGEDENGNGKVFVAFVVEKDGSLTDIKIARGISPEFDAEALRLMKHMPKWQPGIQNGKPVRVAYSMPIDFSAN